MKLTTFLIVSMLALVTGCMPTYTNVGSYHAYTPDQLAGKLPATIKLGQDYALSIVAIDGKSPGCKFLQCPLEVHVVPGKHSVHLRFMNRKGQHTDSHLWLVADPGKTYLAKFQKSGSWMIRIWLEDEDTGLPVGGISGSDDEPT